MMMELGRVLCVFWAICASARADDSLVVRTTQGPVRGHRDPEGGLFAFYNVPYATAPTGQDRFKAPLPAPKWITTFDAVNRGIICPQPTSFLLDKGLSMREDCLVANIYVPDTKQTNLPVVVLVHGGAYQIGYGEMIKPKHLVRTKKVVYVNINYRLGAHGFLCLGTPDVPGNAGMKDIVAALRWVKENIANFRGNPDDVTIQGGSAGSSAVDLILLSKSARGLFNKAIPESAANVGMISVQIDPIANAKEFATKYADFKDVDDIYALEEFYKNSSYELLHKDLFVDRSDSSFIFVPCVERETGVERFLVDSPVNILKTGDYSKVPMLYGFANMEGLFRLNFVYESFSKGMNEKFSDYLPHDLQFESEEEKEKVATQIKEFYFGDKEVGEETILGYIDYFSDIMFAYPMLRSVKLQVEAGNDKIYLYEYGFPQEHNVPSGSAKKVQGANHCAQSAAVLDGTIEKGMMIYDETNLPENLKKMKTIVREYWLNFITTGSPTVEGSSLPVWPASNASGAPHMFLTLRPEVRDELLPQRARFWDGLYSRYYRAPTAPPTPPMRTLKGLSSKSHTEL